MASTDRENTGLAGPSLASPTFASTGRGPSTPTASSTTPTPTGSASSAPGSALPHLLGPALTQLAATIEADGSVRVGVAAIAISPSPGQPTTAGSLLSAPAWSTMKVPLVLAVQHQRPPSEATHALMVAAITASDNAAADQLYASLGDNATASALVQRELAAHDDPDTVVPTHLQRSGFSIIGQTQWTLTHAARFAASLPCSSDATEVWQLMGQISKDQRWGLGRLGGAHFKGGWGPQSDGSYLVRQIGVVSTPSGGMVAVAIAAQASDGSFEAGTLALDRLSTALGTLLASASSTC